MAPRKEACATGVAICLAILFSSDASHCADETAHDASATLRDATEMLLDAGASISEEDNRSQTPLQTTAINGGAFGVAQRLVDQGADVNAADVFGWTPLHVALLTGDGQVRHDMVRTLLEHGARSDAETLLAGWRPLHIAARQESPEIVELLLEHGADINARTRYGARTPLHLALRHRSSRKAAAKEVVDILKAAGALDQSSEEALPRVYFAGLGAWGQGGESWENVFYPAPSTLALGGGEVVRGAFTEAGADERLFIRTVGETEHFFAYLHGLLDKEGRMRLQWLSDHGFRFVELSRDEDGIDRPVYWLDPASAHYPPYKVTMRYDARSGLFWEESREAVSEEDH